MRPWSHKRSRVGIRTRPPCGSKRSRNTIPPIRDCTASPTKSRRYAPKASAPPRKHSSNGIRRRVSWRRKTTPGRSLPAGRRVKWHGVSCAKSRPIDAREDIATHLDLGEKALAEEKFHQAALELQAALDAGRRGERICRLSSSVLRSESGASMRPCASTPCCRPFLERRSQACAPGLSVTARGAAPASAKARRPADARLARRVCRPPEQDATFWGEGTGRGVGGTGARAGDL